MLGERGCHPGMRELEKSSAAGAKENGGLAAEPPGGGVRAEYAGARIRAGTLDGGEKAFQIVTRDKARHVSIIGDMAFQSARMGLHELRQG